MVEGLHRGLREHSVLAPLVPARLVQGEELIQKLRKVVLVRALDDDASITLEPVASETKLSAPSPAQSAEVLVHSTRQRDHRTVALRRPRRPGAAQDASPDRPLRELLEIGHVPAAGGSEMMHQGGG